MGVSTWTKKYQYSFFSLLLILLCVFINFLLQEILRINSKDLPADQLEMIVSAKQTENPLFLITLVKVNRYT